MKTKKVNNKALQVERKKDFDIFQSTMPHKTGEPKVKELQRDNFIYNAF